MAQVRSIGIIMDGNRRWAKAAGKSSSEGHMEGLRRLRDCVEWARERPGITDLFFYALSTENWKRAPREVEYLLLLAEFFFRVHAPELEKANIRIRIAGQRTRFSTKLQSLMTEIEENTKHATGLTVWLGLSYGGRAEILDGVFQMVMNKTPISEEDLAKHLWTAGLPDPDLIIRTGGEKRLSNFLTWSSVYSELTFTNTVWPAITRDEFYQMLDESESRDRRMGE